MKHKFAEKNIQYQNAFELYSALTDNGIIPALLMESRTINLAYGKRSIIATNLALKVSGKNEGFRIDALTEQGINLLGEFTKDDFPFALSYSQSKDYLEGIISRHFNPEQTEEERIRNPSAATFLKAVMEKFQTNNKFAGLYGAFAYDFVRNFEDIGHRHDNKPGDDFALFLPTTIYVFDEIRQKGVQYELEISGDKRPFQHTYFADRDFSVMLDLISLRSSSVYKPRLESMSESEYIRKTASIISDIKSGRFMQCVLSRSISIPLIESPLNSYEGLREINPSPYCFFFNLGGGEFLYGSSPEIHAVVEDGIVTIRPLAGTRRRSQNPLEDAELRKELLLDDKENSEHIMLVDLARNDVGRLCEPKSVVVTDVFTFEQYPNLYHLASGVKGRLREGVDSIDVILTTLPAGTLSGAPKLEGMKEIEQSEETRRGFYGGCIGYIAFNGDCNTGITIRSVYVNNGYSTVQAGAGIVANSIPENEAEEVMLKLSKPLQNLEARLK